MSIAAGLSQLPRRQLLWNVRKTSVSSSFPTCGIFYRSHFNIKQYKNKPDTSWTAWPLKTGPTCRRETSVTTTSLAAHHHTRKSELHRGWNPKFHTDRFLWTAQTCYVEYVDKVNRNSIVTLKNVLIWCRREDQYTTSSSWTPYPDSTYTYHTHWHTLVAASTVLYTAPEDGHEPCPKHVE